MARSVSVAIVAAMTLVLLGGAVFWAGDRQTVVPPPESAGEQLLRQLHAHREVRTEQLLASSVKEEWAPHRLREWWHDIERRVGDVRQITGTRNVIDGDRASAWVDVQGRTGSIVVRLDMRREHGLWMVAQLPPDIE